MEAVLREHKSKRSLAQNNLLHAWMRFISMQVYESRGDFIPPEKWKLYFKSLFLGEESFEVNGKIITQVRSTAKMKVKEMNEFLTNIDHYCGSEFGIYLPRPGEGESF